MLPQPYVTTVMANNENVRIALDVTKEWEKLSGSDSTVVTGVVVVNNNVDSAAQLVEDFDIFKAAIAKKAIPNCNITFINGNEMKTKINNYLKVLYDENEASVGGKLPEDDFYAGL